MKEGWPGVIAGGWGEESDSDIREKNISKYILNMYKIY